MTELKTTWSAFGIGLQAEELDSNIPGWTNVLLYKGSSVGKNKSVHRLVAEAFIPNDNNYPQVNHKDENKFNNKGVMTYW